MNETTFVVDVKTKHRDWIVQSHKREMETWYAKQRSK